MKNARVTYRRNFSPFTTPHQAAASRRAGCSCAAEQDKCENRHGFSECTVKAAACALKDSAASIAASAVALQLLSCGVPGDWTAADAVLNSPNAQIARSTDSALRRATPAFNTDVKDVQDKLEDIQFLLRIPQRKPWGGMAKDVTAAQGLVASKTKMMALVPAESKGDAEDLLKTLTDQLEKLQFAIDRKDPDKTSVAVANALGSVANLEVLQAPALTFKVPAAYANRPLLTGRAVVELTVEKASGEPAFIDSVNGGLLKQGVIQITLDGYSAPVSAGNFAALVKAGKYDGLEWGSGYASVVAGKGAAPGTQVPLEILPLGEFEPVYRLPLDVRGGELPVLPLSVRGSVAMGRGADSTDQGQVSGEEFFLYKFDPSQAGLAGLAFDEGEFGVMGYVTRGMEEVVARLDTGDKIVSAKIVSGLDRLKNAP